MRGKKFTVSMNFRGKDAGMTSWDAGWIRWNTISVLSRVSRRETASQQQQQQLPITSNRCYRHNEFPRVIVWTAILMMSRASGIVRPWQAFRFGGLSMRAGYDKGKEGKERKRIYIAPFIYYVYLKALRHGSHSFTWKYTMPAFPSYAFTRWRHL